MNTANNAGITAKGRPPVWSPAKAPRQSRRAAETRRMFNLDQHIGRPV